MRSFTFMLGLLSISGCGVGLCVEAEFCTGQAEVYDNGSFGAHDKWSSNLQTMAVGTSRVFVSGSNLSAFGTYPLDGTGAVDLSGEFIPDYQSTGPDTGAFWNSVPANDTTESVYYVGVFSSVGGTTANSLVRLLPTGEVDPSFVQGAGLTGFPSIFGYSVARNGSGAIYLTGPISSYAGVTLSGLVKIQNNGSHDASFNVAFGSGNELWPPFSGTTLAVMDDGTEDVLVQGSFTMFAGVGVNGIVRINSNGTRDAGFNGGAGFTFGSFGDIRIFVVPGTAEVFAAGAFTTYRGVATNNLIRILSNGTTDATFSVGTGFTSTLASPVQSIAFPADATGDIYIGGQFTSYNGTAAGGLLRLAPDGSIRTSFQSGTGVDGLINHIAMAPDGSGDLFASGNFTSYNDIPVKHLIRIASDGSLRPGFEADSQFLGDVFAIKKIPSDSKLLYFAGSFTHYRGEGRRQIVRLRPDGSADSTFQTGVGFAPVGNWTTNVASLALTSDEHLYAAGRFTHYQGSAAGNLIRLLPDGSPDPAFSVGTGFDGYINDIVQADDGSGDVFVGGVSTTYQGVPCPRYLARVNSDGSLDSSFNIGTGFSGGEVRTLALAGDGSGDIFVGGSFTLFNGSTANRILRLNGDGSVDTEFAIGTGFNLTVYDLVASESGVWVAGAFTTYQGQTVQGLVKLTRTGAFDQTFSAPTLQGTPWALGSRSDGSMFVATSNATTGTSSILKIGASGTVDASLDTGQGFKGVIYSLMPAPDGTEDLYVGGSFHSYNGTTADSVARLSPKGILE